MCQHYLESSFLHEKCQGCPVREYTGIANCGGTPYVDWVHEFGTSEDKYVQTNAQARIAQAELDFLYEVLQHVEQKNGGNSMSKKHKIKLRIACVTDADHFFVVKIKNIKEYIATLKHVDNYIVFMYYRKHIYTIKASQPNIVSHIIDVALAVDEDEPNKIYPTWEPPNPTPVEANENWAAIFMDDNNERL